MVNGPRATTLCAQESRHPCSRLRTSTGAVYSGDITDAPEGATEFIDVPLHTITARCIVPQVNIYAGEGFNEVAESMFGWMIRDHAQAGAPFEARTAPPIATCYIAPSCNHEPYYEFAVLRDSTMVEGRRPFTNGDRRDGLLRDAPASGPHGFGPPVSAQEYPGGEPRLGLRPQVRSEC